MMSRKSVSVTRLLMAVTCLLLASTSGWAQQSSGIAGQAQDASGAVLPGVTVEVTSPALIEKVRTVVTDGQGRYSVTALVPGTYAITFTLPGFKVVRQEGIVLTTGFTATVNAEMAIGGLEETITVTSASPIVDTASVEGRTLVSNQLLDAMPAANLSLNSVMKLTPGLVTGGPTSTDVGGSRGVFWGNSMSGIAFHGKGNARIFLDGLVVSDFVSGIVATTPARLEASGYFVNLATVQETAFESSGISAESQGGGMSMNSIPKSGGNTFSFSGSGMYTNEHLRSNNLTDAQVAAGLTNLGNITTMYNVIVAVGGAIRQDRLWFFAAPKGDYLYGDHQGPYNYNATQGTPFYTPDPARPADLTDKVLSTPVRLTWQASRRDTVNVFADTQPYCGCPQSLPGAPEVSFLRKSRTTLVQGSWARPVSSRFLLEAGGQLMALRVDVPRYPNTSENDIAILDSTTGILYNARTTLGLTSWGDKASNRYAQRVSASYVTGSHNFKVGAVMDEGRRREQNVISQSISYTFRGSTPGNATPLSLTMYATPYTSRAVQKMDLNVYVQDRWTVKRMTVNAGLQFGYANAYAPAQEVPATRFLPARRFDKVSNVPSYTDLNPRVGVAYDLFGDGRTALKTSVSRYVIPVGVGLAIATNPLLTSVNTVNRTWNDTTFGAGDLRNGNYVPDCELTNPVANGECGPYQNLNFGRSAITNRWDPRTTEGFGARDGLWEVTAEVQQQVTTRLSVTGGYSRNWYFGQRVVRNLLVNPATDYSPFTVVAPVDARLPGGGGYTVSGLYDLNPNKVGQVDNVIVPASDYGKPYTRNDFLTFKVQTQWGTGVQVGGGLDTGRSVTDTCFVVNSPQDLLNCHLVTGWGDQTQLRLFAAIPLPRGFSLSGIFTNAPGLPATAAYTVTSDQIVGLGRALSTRTAVVPLIVPSTEFDERSTLLDVQLSKTFELNGGYRLRPSIGVYNALNADNVATRVNTFGRLFGPSTIVPGRMIQFSAQLTF